MHTTHYQIRDTSKQPQKIKNKRQLLNVINKRQLPTGFNNTLNLSDYVAIIIGWN
jgi:hypothetical protein